MTDPTPENIHAAATAFNEALREMGFAQGVAIQVDAESSFAGPRILATTIFNFPLEPTS